MTFQTGLNIFLFIVIVVGGIFLWIKFSFFATKKYNDIIDEQETKIKNLTKEIDEYKDKKKEWDEKIKNNEALKDLNTLDDFMQFSNNIKRN